jgi:hypothetical protein
MKYLSLLFLFSYAITIYSQEPVKQDTVVYWSKGGYGSLNLNQVSLSNWAKGGESSISTTAMLNLFLNYKQDNISWENTLDMGYGVIKSDDDPSRKNEDKIDFSSKLGYKAMEKLFYTFLMNFKSQFAPGYQYPNDSNVVSRWLAPAYMILSLGMDYQPTENLSIYLSPATGRFIIVDDDKIANGGIYTSQPATYDTTGKIIKEGVKFQPDFGAYFRAKAKYEIITNVTIESKLDLFNNFTDKNSDNRGNIDVNWENTIFLKVNEYISANIFVHLIYDHDTKVPLYEKTNGVKTKIGEGPRLQVKESLGIGLSYKF